MIDNVAFSLGPLQIHWYGIIMGTAALLGVYLATREAKKRGIHPDYILDLALWVLLGAIVGARLYFVLFEWRYYVEHPEDILAVWKGGLAIHGGLIGGFLMGYIYVRKHKLPFLALADLIIPSVLLGQAIGRWGNFLNQEAHGGPVSREFLEGMHLPNWIIEQMNIMGVYYHPTFLYESIWNFVGFLILILLRYVEPRRGEILFTYLIWYSWGRFMIEGLRTDSLAFWGPEWLANVIDGIWSAIIAFEPGTMEYGNIRIAQLVSLVLVVFGLIMIVLRRIKGVTEYYHDFPQLDYPVEENQMSNKQDKKGNKKKSNKKKQSKKK